MNLLGFSKFVSDGQIMVKIARCEPGLSLAQIIKIWTSYFHIANKMDYWFIVHKLEQYFSGSWLAMAVLYSVSTKQSKTQDGTFLLENVSI